MRRAAHVLKDVGHRHLLKNAAVKIVCQQPDPRPQNRSILGIPFCPPAIGKGRHNAVEVTNAIAFRHPHAERHRLADQIDGVDIIVLAEEFDVVFERLAERFLGLHAAKQERALAIGVGRQRAANLMNAIGPVVRKLASTSVRRRNNEESYETIR